MKSLIGVTLVMIIAVSVGALMSPRKPETNDEAIAAGDELARFCDQHNNLIDYYDARRDPPKDDQPWTVELYHLEDPHKGTDPVVWSESGYSHLMDAVVAVERDFDTHPEGYVGHSPEK